MSAVPAGEVIARDEVLGIVNPCAATIGTTSHRGPVAGECRRCMLVDDWAVSGPFELAAGARHRPRQVENLAGREKLAQAIRKAPISDL